MEKINSINTSYKNMNTSLLSGELNSTGCSLYDGIIHHKIKYSINDPYNNININDSNRLLIYGNSEEIAKIKYIMYNNIILVSINMILLLKDQEDLININLIYTDYILNYL